jgi:hypothetical protein
MSTIFSTTAERVLGKMSAFVGLKWGGMQPNAASRLAVARPDRQRAADPRGRLDPETSGEPRSLERLEPQVLHVVRRAMREDAPASPMTRRIQALARQLGDAGWTRDPSQRETVIRQVAREICHSMMMGQGN